jgi:UDP-N-acetylglucosamine acyltransferase
MSGIHTLACVDPSAEIGEGTTIGPFAVIGPGVQLGRDNEIRAHACVSGPGTSLGDRNVVFEGAVIGSSPQDKKYAGERTLARIGDDNEFREHVTVHRGTVTGTGLTTIGSHNMFLVGAHVAHDWEVGSGIVLANNVLLAGHVRVEDRAIVNGAAAMHHFGTIGTLAYVGGLTRLVRDVPPYMVVEGHPARTVKVNTVGMARSGIPEDRVRILQRAFRYVFRRRHATWQPAFEALDADGVTSPEVERLREFFAAMSRGKHGRSREALRP